MHRFGKLHPCSSSQDALLPADYFPPASSSSSCLRAGSITWRKAPQNDDKFRHGVSTRFINAQAQRQGAPTAQPAVNGKTKVNGWWLRFFNAARKLANSDSALRKSINSEIIDQTPLGRDNGNNQEIGVGFENRIKSRTARGY